MSSYGDDLERSSETKDGLKRSVRERAYALWEQDGRSEGRTEVDWHRALDQHLSQRAYALWRREGCPEGRAGDFWHRVVGLRGSDARLSGCRSLRFEHVDDGISSGSSTSGAHSANDHCGLVASSLQAFNIAWWSMLASSPGNCVSRFWFSFFVPSQ